MLLPNTEMPVFAPTRSLDFELETGIFVGTGNALGEPIPVERADEGLFGMVLVNDWSARDVQAWEYQPLGPFLAKNFLTSISPWVVTFEALEPFKRSLGEQEPEPLPHLVRADDWTFDIELEVTLQAQGMTEPMVLTRSNQQNLYWSINQQVAHHTSNGCALRTGDLLASGTISGADPGSRGCMLELSWRGTQPLNLPDGSTRRFLEDGDTVILRGWAHGNGDQLPIGFGEVKGTVIRL
jgi:fumarylacetoacetase